MGLTNLPR